MRVVLIHREIHQSGPPEKWLAVLIGARHLAPEQLTTVKHGQLAVLLPVQNESKLVAAKFGTSFILQRRT